jgi:5'-nucleotidase
VDVTRPAGDRVVEATLIGQALDMSKTYRICLNSFTAGGGDAHANLKTRTGSYYYDTGLIDVDASVEYIKSLGGTVKPVMDGRITVRL